MDTNALLITLVIGGVSGWLAGQITRGSGLGLVGNILVGVVGALIGGWLFARLGVRIGSGMVASLIRAVSGAVVLLLLVGLIKK